MMKRTVLLSIGILIAICLPGAFVHAQGGGDTALQPGEPTIVTLASGQAATRTFSVLAGDFFELRLSRLAEYTYSAVLIGPDQNAMPLLPQPNGNIDEVFDRAALGGTYTLVIQATNGGGDMLVQFDTDAVAPLPLQMGQTPITVESSALRYSLTPPDGMGETVLIVQAVLPAGAPLPFQFGIPATKLVEEATGDTMLSTAASRLPEVSAVLPAGTAFVLTFDPAAAPVDLLVSWVEGSTTGAGTSGTPTPEATVTLAGTLEPGATQALSATGPCIVAFSGGVNVRSGPSTAYDPPLGSAQAGTTLPVTGRNQAGDWYQVSYNGQVGWVSVTISNVTVGGDCSTVQVKSAPPLPTATYTPPPTATPYVTSAPSPTASYTLAPGEQVAPMNDSNYSLTIPYLGSGSISDAVSYPNGDTSDSVFYEVINMNPASPDMTNIQITATCYGTGTEYMVFSTGGQTFGCGETVVNRNATYDSRTGSVIVSATGGVGTYVQWQLYGQSLPPLP